MAIEVFPGDCQNIVRELKDASIDSCVTDPPYALESIRKRFGKPNSAAAKDRDGLFKRQSRGFMGCKWDTGETAFNVEFWAEILRVLKPGGHLVAFGGTRTCHRLACAIEDAGFEIRDTIMWVFGSGFPKSHDVSKGIDKAAGAERRSDYQPNFKNNTHGNGWGGGHTTREDPPATEAAREWQGWGTALKPACEPIVLARKPLDGTVAANVLAHGTGGLNVDGCRVETEDDLNGGTYSGDERRRDEYSASDSAGGAAPLSRLNRGGGEFSQPLGRWPANVCHSGEPEVMEAFAAFGERNAGHWADKPIGFGERTYNGTGARGNSGTAARFFKECPFGQEDSRFHYTSKAGPEDRFGSRHPTVKPVSLMRWLVRLVTPPGGTVLDPFAGSGTTGAACLAEGFDCILIEREAEYLEDIKERLAWLQGEGKHSTAAKGRKTEPEKAAGQDLPLFK